MVKLLFNAYKFYNDLNDTRKRNDLRKNTIYIALLYAVISFATYHFLQTRVDHTMAVTMGAYMFVIGELVIALYFYKKIKATERPMLLQSADLLKSMVPDSLSRNQKIMLVGASLFVIMFVLPRLNNHIKS